MVNCNGKTKAGFRRLIEGCQNILNEANPKHVYSCDPMDDNDINLVSVEDIAERYLKGNQITDPAYLIFTTEISGLSEMSLVELKTRLKALEGKAEQETQERPKRIMQTKVEKDKDVSRRLDAIARHREDQVALGQTREIQRRTVKVENTATIRENSPDPQLQSLRTQVQERMEHRKAHEHLLDPARSRAISGRTGTTTSARAKEARTLKEKKQRMLWTQPIVSMQRQRGSVQTMSPVRNSHV
eukprot:Clim_evm17s11 gene=Clim_evmTU17s11